MTPKDKIEWNRDMREIFGIKESPVVSLPQFVIDRVNPCIKASEEFTHLTFRGELTWVNGVDTEGKRLEDDETWWSTRPEGMPKLTPEFEKWRDEVLFQSLRQYQIVLALIYNYKLEEIPGQTELNLEDDC